MADMQDMMGAMLEGLSKEQRAEMMEAMMDRFFADMTPADKQAMMERMMPRMMEGVNMMEMMPRMMMGMMGGHESGGGMMGAMPSMMAGGQGMGMPMMPHMMTEMMPQCLNMMLPGVPKEARVDFVLNMIATLMEQGSAGMSEEERAEFVARVLEVVTS